MAVDTTPTQQSVTQELIEALGKASASAGLLIHSHGSPLFIYLRKYLETIKDEITSQALKQYDKPVFIRSLS